MELSESEKISLKIERVLQDNVNKRFYDIQISGNENKISILFHDILTMELLKKLHNELTINLDLYISAYQNKIIIEIY